MTNDERQKEPDETVKRYRSKDYARKYKEEYTTGRDFKSFRSRIIASQEITIIRKYLDIITLELKSPGTIIDIPCGTGKLAGLLKEYSFNVIAADSSSEMMELAACEYNGENRPDFMQCKADDTGLSDGSVDTVICLRLFQRLPEFERVAILQEFRRITGKYLVISYSYMSWFQRARNVLKKAYDKDNPAFHQISIDGIHMELAAAGFEVLRVQHVLLGLSSEVIVLAEAK